MFRNGEVEEITLNQIDTKLAVHYSYTYDLQRSFRTELTHDHALQLTERHRFSIYDALIVAAVRDVDCTILYSEDMQHGQLIDSVLVLTNPFANSAQR